MKYQKRNRWLLVLRSCFLVTSHMIIITGWKRKYVSHRTARNLPPNQKRLHHLQMQITLFNINHALHKTYMWDRLYACIIIKRRNMRSRIVPADAEASLCCSQETKICWARSTAGRPPACPTLLQLKSTVPLLLIILMKLKF